MVGFHLLALIQLLCPRDMSVKVVDISSWTTEESVDLESRKKTSGLIAEALSSVGMCVIKGHGISISALKSLREGGLRWFTETGSKEKDSFNRGPYGCVNGGYTSMGVEAVAASAEGKKAHDHVDAVESFVFWGQPSKGFPGEDLSFLSEAESYYLELVKLLRTMHAIVCSALGVEEDFFYQGEAPIISKPVHSLKCSHYPPPNRADIPASAISRKLRYGAHTDFQDITILRPDCCDWIALSSAEGGTDEVPTSGGLQVFTRGEKWEAVVIDDDNALCVNLGDFWEIWSNGRFRSPPHRVTTSGYPLHKSKAKATTSSLTDKARFSAIFFSIPDDSAVIMPLPGTSPASDAGSSEYEPMTAGEHLKKKLERINS